MDDMQLIRELGQETPLLQAAQLAPARGRLVNAMISSSAAGKRPAPRSWPKRRSLLAGLATAGVIAAVASLLTVAQLDKPNSEVTGSSATVGSPAAPDSSFQLVADTSESAQATAKRLSEALDHALRKEAPGARWIFAPEYAGQKPGPDGVPPQMIVKPDGPKKSEEMFFGGSGVLHEGRKGSLFLRIVTDPAKSRPTPPPDCHLYPNCVRIFAGSRGTNFSCSASPADCVEGTNPSGGKFVVMTLSQPSRAGSNVSWRSYEVRFELADGRILSISHSNSFGGGDGAPPAQPDTPLTREQVTVIANDIASKIKP